MLKNQFRRLSTSLLGKGEKGGSTKAASSEDGKKTPERSSGVSGKKKSGGGPAEKSRRRMWREARDPKTGRTYYYDVETRETQWSKPAELLDASERAEVERREAEKRAFFEEMEANMKRRFADGLTSVDVPSEAAAPWTHKGGGGEKERGIGWRPPRPSSGSFSSGAEARFVRTLSTMDDSFLLLAQSSRASRNLSLSPRRDSNAENVMPRIPEASAGLPVAAGKKKTRSQRASSDLAVPPRNSTGTLFLDATLDAPDKEATIRCVCHVIRAHIAAAADAWKTADKAAFAVFHDADAEGATDPPSIRRLVAFYRDVFSRGQMELECIVTSLIYVERLLKAARGKFRLRPTNWRPVLLSCMIMASKVCDDLSMWNADFSHICRAFDLARINALEAALLQAYGFNATVAASEYAKYYFHLRSMAARLGLANSDQAHAPRPLDVGAARAIAARSSKRFAAAANRAAAARPDAAQKPPAVPVRRAQSIGVESKVEDAINKTQKPRSRPAILEEIVDMAPNDSPPRP
mmetsp:Transcript_6356/g.19281  ORF Transcript_6356/g.19281 Transcript_6356/m.19281 type:complete len:522 (+) Transcript_6356:102-1667(+)